MAIKPSFISFHLINIMSKTDLHVLTDSRKTVATIFFYEFHCYLIEVSLVEVVKTDKECKFILMSKTLDGQTTSLNISEI